MRLIGNKIEIIGDNVKNRIHRKEKYGRSSNIISLWNKQRIWIHFLISSDFLIFNIYDEIRR